MTEAYLEQRAKRGSRSRFDEALAKVADIEPTDIDRLVLSRRRVIPPQPAKVPSRRAIRELTKGAGTAASETVEGQRSSR